MVQVYVVSPNADGIDRPFKELKGFKKVSLAAGESKTVTLSIRVDALSFYDETSQAWKAEAGDFEALIGTAADQIKQRVAFKLVD